MPNILHRPEAGRGAGRALVVRGGALGDFILVEPSVRALGERGLALDLVADPRYVALLPPGSARSVTDPRSAAALWLHGGGAPPHPLPDFALVYTPGVAEGLRDLGVPEVVEVAPRPPTGVSALRHFNAPLLGVAADRPPRLSADPRLRATLERRIPAGAVVLAPGAAAPAKRWSRLEAVARHLRGAGVPVVWAPGRDEGPFSAPGELVLEGLDLPSLVALASSARAWLGMDTGTSHLAQAAGCPTWALFGPTDPAVWCPAGATPVPFDAAPRAVAQALLDATAPAPG